MAKDKDQAGKRGGKDRDDSIPYDPQQLSPRKADEQDSPADVRPPTPIEEAGERKGSTEGLAERDED